MKNSMLLFLVAIGLLVTTSCQKEELNPDVDNGVVIKDPVSDEPLLTRVITFRNGEKRTEDITYNEKRQPTQVVATSTNRVNELVSTISYDGDDVAEIFVDFFEGQFTQLIVFEDGFPRTMETRQDGLNPVMYEYFFAGNEMIRHTGQVIQTFTFDDQGNLLSKLLNSGSTSFLTEFNAGSALNPFRDMKFQAHFILGDRLSENVIVGVSRDDELTIESEFTTDAEGRVTRENRITSNVESIRYFEYSVF